MNVRSALKWRIGAWRSVHRSPVRRPRLWPLLLFLSGLMGAAAPLVWLGVPAYEEQQALRLSLESVKREREAARARLELSSDRLKRLQAQVTSLPQVEPVGEAADALMPQQLALAHALHLSSSDGCHARGALRLEPQVQARRHPTTGLCRCAARINPC
jgi:hypothetical protein